ncbi:MAG: hypothetical protein K0S33_3300 [Bacteroidetes bacterium]|nr:hypothetical protein [Bacteroidota bacterium]
MKDPFSHIEFGAIAENRQIRKILVIRLQASGDVVISLPYLQSLRKQLPEVEIDLLVREECKGIPEQLTIFNTVHVLKGGRNSKLQLFHFFLLFPKLFLKKYDVLLDLQNHRLSRIMRRMLGIKAWSVFDRTSSLYAGDRYKNTINVMNIATVSFEPLNSFRDNGDGWILEKFGLKEGIKYIVINPAGVYANRNLEMEKYLQFCRLWLEMVDPGAVFLLIGISAIEQKAAWLQEKLGNSAINLVNRTSQAEAVLLLRKARVMISEDSGLLHMAYAVGTPSVGILGSTRNDWTNPNLPHTRFFHSSDLACGNCMLPECLYAGTPCLDRISPEMILNAARAIKDLRES